MLSLVQFNYLMDCIVFMIKNILVLLILALGAFVLTSCETTQTLLKHDASPTQLTAAQTSPVNIQGFPNDPVFWQNDTVTTWNKLQHIPLPELQSAVAQTTDDTMSSWLKLAIISKQYSTDTNQLVTQLTAWRTVNSNHAANSLFPNNDILTHLQTAKVPQHIALLLPLQGPLSDSGQAVRDGFMSAYYGSTTQSQQTISFFDTNQNPNIIALYQKAIKEGADSIVGPLTKENVQQLLSTGKFSTPTLALNYTDVWFGSLPTHFYEFGLSPIDEVKQLAEKSWQTGHKRALLIAPQDAWGQRVAKPLITNWQSLGGSIADTLYFNDQTDLNKGIAGLLHANPNGKNSITSRRQDFDIILLLAPPQTARQIVPLLKFYYAANVPIYATSVVYSGTPSPQKDSDLNGVTFADIPWTLQMANTPTVSNDSRFNRLYALGRDAFLLSNQFNRLNLLPNFPMYGATGALTLTSQQQIYRRLAWVQMHNGRP